MRIYDLINKKRHSEKLSRDEIEYIVNGYTNGEIPDYQMSALLMAICINGMDMDETINLTMAMAHSGDMLDLSPINGLKADKHSTGGVGDKTSLVTGPMVAALGVPVAKMSGRGLGHTGGTIDKLESFPGFSTAMTTDRFFENVNKIKLAIVGQTANLAPADKKLYALRDVTATVENLSLISSSIMSKKLAAGSDVIVLDVKTGSGAFMKTLEDSVALAEAMVRIGTGVGRKTYGVISDMNQPLGCAIGNSLEVIEAIDALKGQGPDDLVEVAVTMGAYMLLGVGRAESIEEARRLLFGTIKDGSALRKMAEFVSAQGGDESYVYDTDKFAKASIIEPVFSDREGYVNSIHTDDVGMASLILGGGRETKESTIDLSVGIIIHKKIGDMVEKDTPIATLHANSREKFELAKERLLGAYTIGEKPLSIPKHIYGIVTSEGTVL